MPIQIKRHLLVLIILVGIFIVFRQLMIPDSFGDIGHYRANSLGDNEALEMVYAGQESCIECHEDMSELKEFDLHSDLACESCHGPGLFHIINPDSVDFVMPGNREDCGLCHQYNASRNKDAIIQINLNEHNPDKNCTFCHNPHAPWELRNQDLPEEPF
jgi:hypothetical protein